MEGLLTCIFCVLSASTLVVSARYPTYIVDELCNDKTEEFFNLNTSGRGSAAILEATRENRYALCRECKVKLMAEDLKQKITVSVEFVDLRIKEDGCFDYIEINKPPFANNEKFQLCEFNKSEGNLSFESQNMLATLDYHSERVCCTRHHRGFKLVATAFKKSMLGNCPEETSFLCDNNHCIWKGLRCDGYDNCGDLSDEKGCQVNPEPNSGVSGGVIAGVIIAVLVVVVAIIVGVGCMRARRRQDPSNARLVEGGDS